MKILRNTMKNVVIAFDRSDPSAIFIFQGILSVSNVTKLLSMN